MRNNKFQQLVYTQRQEVSVSWSLSDSCKSSAHSSSLSLSVIPLHLHKTDLYTGVSTTHKAGSWTSSAARACCGHTQCLCLDSTDMRSLQESAAQPKASSPLTSQLLKVRQSRQSRQCVSQAIQAARKRLAPRGFGHQVTCSVHAGDSQTVN